ncbi:MAG: integrase core domain-containing protein [Bdellovibrionales bacterium]|nr:integrase core domain-containing protein [Bdellovibrionales bacterium]
MLPLTLTDHHSRYLLACEAYSSVKAFDVFSIYEHCFNEYGLPKAIRSDNGVPFAVSHALHGLSQLSVWWLRLGIKIERIKPGHPEQNGQHERMHRTLKQHLKPAKANLLQQQEVFDDFQEEFNFERPHEAIDMKTPSEVYCPSEIKLPEQLDELEYPLEDSTKKVTKSGDIWLGRNRVYVGRAFRGYNVGYSQVEDDLYLLKFMDYELGFFDLENRRVISHETIFDIKL